MNGVDEALQAFEVVLKSRFVLLFRCCDDLSNGDVSQAPGRHEALRSLHERPAREGAPGFSMVGFFLLAHGARLAISLSTRHSLSCPQQA